MAQLSQISPILFALTLLLLPQPGRADEQLPTISTEKLRAHQQDGPSPFNWKALLGDEDEVGQAPDSPLWCTPPEGPWPNEEATLILSPPTLAERNEVMIQTSRCLRSVERTADPWKVLALLRLEEKLGVPDELTGIFGAIWCFEGAMRTEASKGGPIRGDIDASGYAHARGPFQGHDWLWRWCGMKEDAADNLYNAARCYWARVADRHENVASRCKGSAWVVAEALTANGPKYAKEGCKAVSGHVRELRTWRQWEKRHPEDLLSHSL